MRAETSLPASYQGLRFSGYEEYYILGCEAVPSGTSSHKFRKNVLSPSSGLDGKLRKQPERESQRQKDCYLHSTILESANTAGFTDVSGQRKNAVFIQSFYNLLLRQDLPTFRGREESCFLYSKLL
jgi:SET domain-containing protein